MRIAYGIQEKRQRNASAIQTMVRYGVAFSEAMPKAIRTLQLYETLKINCYNVLR